VSVAAAMLDELLARARRLEGQASEGEVDHDAIAELTQAILSADLGPDEAHTLHEVVSSLTLAVQTQRDAVRSQLGGVAKKSRAIRGFGRVQQRGTFLRGQRVNKGV